MYANSFLTPEIDKERRTNNRRSRTKKGALRQRLGSILTSLLGVHK